MLPSKETTVAQLLRFEHRPDKGDYAARITDMPFEFRFDLRGDADVSVLPYSGRRPFRLGEALLTLPDPDLVVPRLTQNRLTIVSRDPSVPLSGLFRLVVAKGTEFDTGIIHLDGGDIKVVGDEEEPFGFNDLDLRTTAEGRIDLDHLVASEGRREPGIQIAHPNPASNIHVGGGVRLPVTAIPA
jgi:hypothetical protein